MSAPRVGLVVAGRIVVAAGPDGFELAEAVGIAEGRVVMTGTRDEVIGAAGPHSRVVDAGESAVVPGIHDFHLHLAALARARLALRLDDAADGSEVARRLADGAASLSRGAWLSGRGWTEAQMATTSPERLRAAVGTALAFLSSHDGHSAWASPGALRLAGIGESTPDPPGGRIERDAAGLATGVLRETALELVDVLVPQARGEALHPALDATLREMAALGITGATEAGDYTTDGGAGPDAGFGDSYSALAELGDLIDGRLRMTLGIPVDAIPAAAERAFRTGAPLAGRRTMRFGWAKEYADGALGSGTAALFEPSTCGGRDAGILRVTEEELDGLVIAARSARIGLAIHAIGDRAAATVLDALDRGPARVVGVPDDRMEHIQLLREADAARFARLGTTASIQPIHAAADRDLVERCWAGRQERAYAWRRLSDAGALLAAGSDAPIESVNPWLGMFAAVHRRLPGDARRDWRPEQALTAGEALAAYTIGPATAIGADDEGHLRPGARADLAVLDIGLDALEAGDERLATARSVMTLVDGVEVPLA